MRSRPVEPSIVYKYNRTYQDNKKATQHDLLSSLWYKYSLPLPSRRAPKRLILNERHMLTSHHWSYSGSLVAIYEISINNSRKDLHLITLQPLFPFKSLLNFKVWFMLLHTPGFNFYFYIFRNLYSKFLQYMLLTNMLLTWEMPVKNPRRYFLKEQPSELPLKLFLLKYL